MYRMQKISYTIQNRKLSGSYMNDYCRRGKKTMEYEFLQQFPKRMKSVGMYSLLVKNSWQKTTWKQFDFDSMDEQLNMIFAVLLFVMEQSLKEEPCTMDDISAYVDLLGNQYFGKRMTYDMSRELSDFIINVILCDEGRAMYFDCYDFEKKKYKPVNISYLSNEIIYVEDEVKRTSYQLTDNGYNLILSTLEVENNMKLTIHEIIFKMHLERATYDKALDEVKNIFNLLRIQLQKMEEAMNRIRRNALSYSVYDYQEILEENLAAIEDTKEKFLEYRQVVRTRAKELEEENINVRALGEEDAGKLKNLQKIEQCLERAIDEHQRILNHHFDLKELYAKELEQMSQMATIKRFSLRSELYDPLIEHPGQLTQLEYFLRPLFQNEVNKIYHLNRCLELQRPIRKKAEEEEGEMLEFDAEEFERQKEECQRKRLKKYQQSMHFLLERVVAQGSLKLSELAQLTEIEKSLFIPNVEIFREIMVEFLKSKTIDIEVLRQERSQVLSEENFNFQLNEMLLDIVEQEGMKELSHIEIMRTPEENIVTFENVRDEEGNAKTIRCSDILFRCKEKTETMMSDRNRNEVKYGI